MNRLFNYLCAIATWSCISTVALFWIFSNSVSPLAAKMLPDRTSLNMFLALSAWILSYAWRKSASFPSKSVRGILSQQAVTSILKVAKWMIVISFLRFVCPLFTAHLGFLSVKPSPKDAYYGYPYISYQE